MEAHIEADGTLVIQPDTETETYALNQWVKPHPKSTTNTLPGNINIYTSEGTKTIGCYLVNNAS